VTAVTCLFIIKEKKKKRNIKSRKIDKKKKKNVGVQAHYNSNNGRDVSKKLSKIVLE